MTLSIKMHLRFGASFCPQARPDLQRLIDPQFRLFPTPFP